MHVGPEPPPPDGSPASESMRQKHVGLKRQFSAGVSLSSLESHVLPGLQRLTNVPLAVHDARFYNSSRAAPPRLASTDVCSCDFETAHAVEA